LLAALYWHCDWRRVAAAVAQLDLGYLALAFLLFVPQTLVSAWRWQRLAAPLCLISLGEAVRQTLAASESGGALEAGRFHQGRHAADQQRSAKRVAFGGCREG
jgi:hypothetical protein